MFLLNLRKLRVYFGTFENFRCNPRLLIIPPALRKANGKFNIPAPKAAFTTVQHLRLKIRSIEKINIGLCGNAQDFKCDKSLMLYDKWSKNDDFFSKTEA